ncbi:MAG: toxin TcdB middle/N-terminal domain-containing protein, partial [Kofleriaceae bacterium]
MARQTDRGVPHYDDRSAWHPNQDRFVYGSGAELVPIGMVLGGACTGAPGEAFPAALEQWQYFRARVESSFLRFFWSPNHKTWIVQSKAGVTVELGEALDTTGGDGAIEADPASSNRIFRWNVAREYDLQRDAKGRPVNVVAYRYAKDRGTAYLTDIYDTSPASRPASSSVHAFAHHTRLVYDTNRHDPRTSYQRGWETVTGWRLVGVDVTSAPFAGGTREAVRRYHLDYDPSAHASLLTSVTVEGRCADPIAGGVATEMEDGGLSSTTCETLPAVRFGYQHVTPTTTQGTPGVADLPGYEGFDERLIAIAQGGPKFSIDGNNTDLFDFDSDGLPDVLVSAAGWFGGKQGLYRSSPGGQRDSFGAAIKIGVLAPPWPSPNANVDPFVLAFSNSNTMSLDVDGDASVNLLHMPKVKTYAVFTPSMAKAAWVGSDVVTADQNAVKIDFTHDATRTRVMDVNGDGLVDLVRATGTEYQTFFALGRYPSGDGRFGQASWTGAISADLSAEPAAACVPWDAAPVLFDDADVRVADMNGDGFPDIVRTRPGDIRYWPGRGDGTWGTQDPSTCLSGTYTKTGVVAMGESPWYQDLNGNARLDDVSGDGLPDLVIVRDGTVDIWINVDGAGWTETPHTIFNTPPTSAIQNRVRLADMNGSGTRDILWGDGLGYRYMDLLGGKQPWILTSVDNGLGATTALEYASSTSLMLDAEAGKGGQTAWTSKSPVVTTVVTQVTVRDHLEGGSLVQKGSGKHAQVTHYQYRDLVYDGRQRELRGFREATVTSVGDTDSPTSRRRTSYLLGECVDEDTLDHVNPCALPERWRDNPREGLKGLARTSETFDGDEKVYLSTEHVSYRLRELFEGLDGRAVRHAFAEQTDTYLYDTAPPFAPWTKASPVLKDVTTDVHNPYVAAAANPSSQLAIREETWAHLHTSVDIDRFGNVRHSYDDGVVERSDPDACLAGGCTKDEVLAQHHTPGLVGTTGWLWASKASWVTGSAHPGKFAEQQFRYDALGRLTDTIATLSGTLPLKRYHQAGGAIAPPPAGAVTDGKVPGLHHDYDDFGNVVHSEGPGGQCGDVVHDAAFAQLPVSETSYTGALGANGCGEVPLTTTATGYVRGFAALTDAVGPAGEPSHVDYDAFGRGSSIFRPKAEGGLSSHPSVQIAYLPTTDAASQPYSRVHVMTQVGTEASPVTTHAWSYVDGLGRTILTVGEADRAHGDAGAWIVSGWMAYDARG